MALLKIIGLSAAVGVAVAFALSYFIPGLNGGIAAGTGAVGGRRIVGAGGGTTGAVGGTRIVGAGGGTTGAVGGT